MTASLGDGEEVPEWFVVEPCFITLPIFHCTNPETGHLAQCEIDKAITREKCGQEEYICEDMGMTSNVPVSFPVLPSCCSFYSEMFSTAFGTPDWQNAEVQGTESAQWMNKIFMALVDDDSSACRKGQVCQEELKNNCNKNMKIYSLVFQEMSQIQ